MSGYGLVWSLLIAAVVAAGGVFALPVDSDRPGALFDRMLVGGGAGLLMGRLAAVSFGGVEIDDTFADFGGDLDFWLIAAGTLGWASRTRRPAPWRDAMARLLDVVPSILLAYGIYRSLCLLRRGCIEAASWPLLDIGSGVVLIGIGFAVRFAWTVSIANRLLIALLATATMRMVLGPLGSDAGLRGSALSIAISLLAGAALARSAINWFRGERVRRRLSRSADEPPRR